MKITKVDILLSNPVEDGWRPIFCRVYTDEGIYGDGECALSYGDVEDGAFGVMKNIAKFLIGMNPLQHEVIWETLYKKCFFAMNGGPLTYGAISAFDIAMWDIKGKKYNVPVYELLGGKMRDKLRCYASQLQNGMGEERKKCLTPEDYALVTQKAINEGFDAVKINFTTFREDGTRYVQDEQTAYLSKSYMNLIESRIKAVREVLGPNRDLILENHAYTDKQTAVQMGNMAKKYDIMYFEEPVRPHADLLSYVYKQTGIPIASGERLYSRMQFKEAFEKEAIQVIQPDVGTCGGITEVKKLCDLAQMYETAVQIHTCGSPLITTASLHLEAVIPGFIIHEYNVNTAMSKMCGLTKYDYKPINGYYTVPDLPGIGNEIAEKTFANSKVVTIS